jgi:hypothetical protein
MVRPRGSSALGVDIRGDTSAPAMSTMNEVSPIEPSSDQKVRTAGLVARASQLTLTTLVQWPGTETDQDNQTTSRPLAPPSLRRHLSTVYLAPAFNYNALVGRTVRYQPYALEPDAQCHLPLLPSRSEDPRWTNHVRQG